MTNEKAIKYLKQLYPNGGHCWLDEQRTEAIGMAIKALQKESASEPQVKESFISKHEDKTCKENDDSLTQEPVSDDLIVATNNYCVNVRKGYPRVMDETDRYICNAFKAGAKWQKEKFEKDCTDLCNGIATAKGVAVAMAYNKGMADAKEQMMKDATEITVHIDAGGYPYIPQMELYDYDKDIPLAKEGDKYKVILIKED